jgi:uncharacterized protein
MRIKNLIWPRERIDHIARHGVTVEEVEEVCYGKSLVRQAKSRGKNPVYFCRFSFQVMSRAVTG